MTLVPDTGLSTLEQYVHWDTSGAGQTIDTFHLEQLSLFIFLPVVIRQAML